MKIIAVNGSPRKTWNTATLLHKALEGAAAQGAETELIHLYDLNYKGCISCYACKLKGGKSYGRCAVHDDLEPVLQRIEAVDGVILGSPIYIGSLTGLMRSFLERLIYSYPFADPAGRFGPLKKKITAAFIYTMGATESQAKETGLAKYVKTIEQFSVFEVKESLLVYDTHQYDDYSKYVLPAALDPEAKLKRRNEEFPKDCQKAWDMGVKLARRAEA